MKDIHIDVTQTHITEGVPKQYAFCPIALAMHEHFGKDADIVDVTVTNRDLYVEYVDDRGTETFIHWTALEGLTDWIESYDKNQEVKPFELVLTDKFAIIARIGDYNAKRS